MIFEEEIYPEEFEQKFEAFDIIQKAFDADQIGSDIYREAYESLEKAKKDLSKLTKKRVFAKRKDGHIYLTTVYVSEGGEVQEDVNAQYVIAPIGTPEVMVGESVKITKKSGEVIEGVVEHMKIFDDNNTQTSQAKIYVSVDGKTKKVTSDQIKKFEKFSSTGMVGIPSGDVDKNGYTILKQLGGSTGALLVEKNGVKYVKKTAANPEHLSSEMRALNYMSQIGVPVPKVQDYIKGEAVYLEFIEGQTLQEVQKDPKVNSSSLGLIYKEISKHFAAQALFANHDTIGLNFDNVMITYSQDGVPKVHFVDVGGSMGYRAQGGLKENWATWNDKCGLPELRSMLDPSLNKQSASVFSHGLSAIAIDYVNDNGDLYTKEQVIKRQLDQIFSKNPAWYSSPGTEDSKKLKARLDAALKLFEPEKPKEQKYSEYLKNRNSNLSYSESDRLSSLKKLYSKEISTAKKYGRDDIAKFYDDFAEHMFMTDKEISDYDKISEDPNPYYDKNDKEFMDSVPGTVRAHLHAIRTHTGSSNHLNPYYRDFCTGLSDKYNISFKNKDKKVSFNKKSFEAQTKINGNSDFLRARIMIDLFARISKTESSFYKKDVTLYRGINASDDAIKTMGSDGDNIYCDGGVSSNGQSYDKAFNNSTIVITTMAEGIDVQRVGTHPNEKETIMKPFNMQQVTKFVDSISMIGPGTTKGRYQVRVEPPGLIPINI